MSAWAAGPGMLLVVFLVLLVLVDCGCGRRFFGWVADGVGWSKRRVVWWLYLKMIVVTMFLI